MRIWEYAYLSFADNAPTQAHGPGDQTYTWWGPDGRSVVVAHMYADKDGTWKYDCKDLAGVETSCESWSWLTFLNEIGRLGWELDSTSRTNAALTRSAPNGGSYYVQTTVSSGMLFKREVRS